MKTLIELTHWRRSAAQQLILAGCCALLSLPVTGKAQATDKPGGDEQKIRELEAAWVAAAAAKDVDKTVAPYAADAVVYAPNAPASTTKDAIRTAWKEMLAPGSSTSWKVSKVEVAKSGDLAYVTGTYEDARTDASGKAVKDTGKLVAIYKKQADGNWKVVVDIWNSDLPAAAPAEKK